MVTAFSRIALSGPSDIWITVSMRYSIVRLAYYRSAVVTDSLVFANRSNRSTLSINAVGSSTHDTNRLAALTPYEGS